MSEEDLHTSEEGENQSQEEVSSYEDSNSEYDEEREVGKIKQMLYQIQTSKVPVDETFSE